MKKLEPDRLDRLDRLDGPVGNFHTTKLKHVITNN